MALTEQMQEMVQQDIEDAATRPKEDILKEQIEGLKTFGKTARDVAIESIPGVGEAIAEQRVKEAQEAGDKVGTAIEMAAMGIGAIPGVGDIVAQGIRRLKSGKIKPKPTAVSGEYYDAPSYGEFHQRAAQADREEGIEELEALRATENPATGIFQETIQKANIGNTRGQTAEVNNVSFNPQELQNIKGLMGEDAFRDTGGKLELLEKRIAEEGYQPSNITIVVREDGTPFIQEGNHRLAEALKSGREEIKADIVYLRNAEKADGPFNPKRLNDPQTDVDLLVRTSYEMENSPVATAAARTTKSPLRMLFDKLPETERAALPPQPDENRLFGYHGTAKAREADEPFFDINFARKNDQFLGEGFYFTLDPEVASEYASIRGIKSERQIKGEKAKEILADENVIPSERGKRGSGTSVEVTPQGEYVTGGSMMKGQDIYGNPVSVGQYIGRFDLSNLEKPYVVRTEKQRKELKKMIPQLKEEGYDSILFADFKDRSKQIMVFPEHMDKINSDAINYAQGGAVPMKEQMEMFEDGGLMDEGGTVDPVSGNDVPPGSTQEEVRDDIPAQLSEGEFVFPADVVRYIGLGNLMRMRQEAKMGLKLMDEMGQMGNSEEATIPDDIPFDINDLDMEDESEYNSEMEMAEGGLVYAQQGTFVPGTPQQQQFGISGYQQAAAPTTGFAPTPVQAASQQFVQPTTQIAQAAVPTMKEYKPAEIPTFQQTIGGGFGEYDEIRQYRNEAGNVINVPFRNGQPISPIPEGYKYVDPEETATEEVTTTPTTPQTTRVSETGDEDRDDGLGPGGGRIGMGGFSDGTGRRQNATIMGVSFNMGEGFIGGAMGAGATALSLATGKPIPTEATATFTFGNQSYTVPGSTYNELKKSGYTGSKADEIVGVLKGEKVHSGLGNNTLQYDAKTKTFTDTSSGETFTDNDNDNDGIGDILNKAGQSIYSKVDKDDLLGSAQKMNDSQKAIASAYNDAQFEAFDFGDDNNDDSGGGAPSGGGRTESAGADWSAGSDFTASEREELGPGSYNAGGLASKKKPKAKKMKQGGMASKK